MRDYWPFPKFEVPQNPSQEDMMALSIDWICRQYVYKLNKLRLAADTINIAIAGLEKHWDITENDAKLVDSVWLGQIDSDFFEWANEHLLEDVPTVVWRGFIISTFTIVECATVAIARFFGSAHKSENGKKLMYCDYVKYLKSKGITSPFGMHQYGAIMNAKDIRNFIVHRDGVVANDKPALMTNGKLTEGLDINEDDELAVDREYIITLLDYSHDHILSLHSNSKRVIPHSLRTFKVS